jgi:hypothetical protein
MVLPHPTCAHNAPDFNISETPYVAQAAAVSAQQLYKTTNIASNKHSWQQS